MPTNDELWNAALKSAGYNSFDEARAAGEGSSGGGGGGGSVADAVAAYASQHEGYRFHGVMQEGTVTEQNGIPGVMVKYDTPNGSSTEWTPLPGFTGRSVPMDAVGGGGSGGGGGSSDPRYNQFVSGTRAAGAEDAASTRTAIQQMLIAFGLVPQGFQDKMGALDDITRSLIGKNTESGISSYARLLQGRTDALNAMKSRQGASGLRRSGARGYALRRGQLSFDQQLADALAHLSGQVGGAYSQYAANERARQQSIADAMGNIGSFGGGGGGGGGTAPAASQYFTAPPGSNMGQQLNDYFNSIGSGSDPYAQPTQVWGGSGQVKYF